jgi:hypothetical protein
MDTDWTACTSPDVEKIMLILKDAAQDVKSIFAAFEAFLDTCSDEQGYFLMVQIRLQLTDTVATDNGFVRRLDHIANQGTQSGAYLKAMQRIFRYIEKEGKKLPVPPG